MNHKLWLYVCSTKNDLILTSNVIFIELHHTVKFSCCHQIVLYFFIAISYNETINFRLKFWNYFKWTNKSNIIKNASRYKYFKIILLVSGKFFAYNRRRIYKLIDRFNIFFHHYHWIFPSTSLPFRTEQYFIYIVYSILIYLSP